MKRIISIVLISILCLSFFGCSKPPKEAVYINDWQTDYTAHAFSDLCFPLSTVMLAIGGERVDSEFEAFSSFAAQVIMLDEKVYVIDTYNHLFMLGDDYSDVVKRAKEESKSLKDYFDDERNLLPYDSPEVTWVAGTEMFRGGMVYVYTDVLKEVFSKMGYMYGIRFDSPNHGSIQLIIKRNLTQEG